MTHPRAHSWPAAEPGLWPTSADSASQAPFCIRPILLFTLFCWTFLVLSIYFFLTLLSFFASCFRTAAFNLKYCGLAWVCREPQAPAVTCPRQQWARLYVCCLSCLYWVCWSLSPESLDKEKADTAFQLRCRHLFWMALLRVTWWQMAKGMRSLDSCVYHTQG